MGNWTSVPVRKATRDKLEDHPEKDGRDWDTFIRREVLGEDIDGGMDNPPEPFEDVRQAVASLEERIGRLETQIDGLTEGLERRGGV